MDWLEFIMNNDAAVGSIIGLAILFGIAVYMAYYFISNIVNADPESKQVIWPSQCELTDLAFYGQTQSVLLSLQVYSDVLVLIIGLPSRLYDLFNLPIE